MASDSQITVVFVVVVLNKTTEVFVTYFLLFCVSWWLFWRHWR